jgi:hypothetical protein
MLISFNDDKLNCRCNPADDLFFQRIAIPKHVKNNHVLKVCFVHNATSDAKLFHAYYLQVANEGELRRRITSMCSLCLLTMVI